MTEIHPILEEIKSVIAKETQEILRNIENPQAKAICEAWVQNCFQSLEEALEVINDDADAQYFVAMRYTAMKATWIELNTYLNYSMVNKGESNENRFHLAGLVSHLLGRIEPHVEPAALAKITHLLTDPLNQV